MTEIIGQLNEHGPKGQHVQCSEKLQERKNKSYILDSRAPIYRFKVACGQTLRLLEQNPLDR